MGDARACLRLYRNKHVLLREGVRGEAETASFGTLMHAGLEPWWQTIGQPDQAATAMTALRTAAGEAPDAYVMAKAEALMLGYHAVYAEADAAAYRALATEAEFRTPLVNPETDAESKTFTLGGKLDGVIDADGRRLVLEHKTSGEDISPGSFYWRRKRMDGQVSIYFDGAKALGHDIEGCLYDVIGKPDLRPLKATAVLRYRKDGEPYAGQRLTDETPAEYRERLIAAIAAEPGRYFVRAEVARDQASLEEAAQDRWQLAVTLREAARTGNYPRNPDACLRFGRPCEFLDACSEGASLDDPDRYRARAANPELSTTPKEEAHT